jgi:beta-galactosidase
VLDRRTASLDRSWRYVPRPAQPDGTTAVPDDAQVVSLPHPTVIVPLGGFDDAVYRFTSTYRRRLRLTPEDADRRVVVRFDGVMTAATLWCNGTPVAEHRGGFVPLEVELTGSLRFDGDDLLCVEVDSSERPDVPPFGGHVDYLTFGGIYRRATLELLPRVFVADAFARPVDVLGPGRRIDVRCTLDAAPVPDGPVEVQVDVLDRGRTGAASATAIVTPDAWVGGRAEITVPVHGLDTLALWDVDTPVLHDVRVRLSSGDERTVRTGLREAVFSEDGGFRLNGRRVHLRGLNRHQTYPHVGAAMPPRVQRRDAEVLRHELGCNAVRTSHYPQDPSFLDACDELGLLVFEEMPGWQHVGDDAWRDLACRDVEAMIRRDRNHPSIVLWGVRVNESMDHDAFYERTNAIAHALDDSRQTSGVRYFRESHLLEDVFALNDFETGGWIHPPVSPRYLVSEYAGHMFPTKRYDNTERVQQHALLHLTVLNALRGDAGIAGGFGWCAFDYNTHADFGSGDRICHHGVADAFRVPKAAAYAYLSQVDPAERVVLEPAFVWAGGDHSDYGGPGIGLILSNCDRIRAYVADEPVAELFPDTAGHPHLEHPPFLFGQTSGIAPWRRTWGDLRLEGYLGDRDEPVVTRVLSGRGLDAELVVTVDDAALVADGADTTRLLVRVTDEHGNGRPFTTGAVTIEVEGPLRLAGPQPVALGGGVAGAWLRATEEPGTATVSVVHPTLGRRSLIVEVEPAPEEPW